MRQTGLVVWVVLIGAPAAAGPPVLAPPSNPLAILGNNTPEAVAGNLRGYLVANLSPVLYEDSWDWGKQKLVTRGIEWKGKGKALPKAQKAHKNDGEWRKVRVTANTLRDTLIVDLRDVQPSGTGRMTFTVYVSFDAQVQYHQENWQSGVRTYSGEVRARMRVKGTMSCEVTSRLEESGGLVPDVVFRLRVVQARVGYDNLVVEHVGGVGGDLAKWLGETFKAGVDKWKPSLQRNALQKANAAIVKAADTKEVRVSLTKLFHSKGILP